MPGTLAPTATGTATPEAAYPARTTFSRTAAANQIATLAAPGHPSPALASYPGNGPAPRPVPATNDVIAVTATRRPRRPVPDGR